MTDYEKYPALKRLLADIRETKFARRVAERLNSGKDVVVKTLAGSLKSLLVASLRETLGTPIIIIAADISSAADWTADLPLFMPESELAAFADTAKKSALAEPASDEEIVRLVDAAEKLASNDRFVAVATPEIFQYKFPSPDRLIDSKQTFKTGETRPFEDFVKSFILNGFDRKDYVEIQGDIAVRGGIVDVFPVGWDNPVRFEFWGDEIESIRIFEPISQRSVSSLEKAEFLTNLFHPTSIDEYASALDYLPANAIIALDESAAVEIEDEDLKKIEPFRKLIINGLQKADVAVDSKPQPQFKGSIRDFSKRLRELAEIKCKTYLCAAGRIHADRFKELVENSLKIDEEQSPETRQSASAEEILESVRWIARTVGEGFFLPRENIALFTEHQVFDRIRTRRGRRENKDKGVTLGELKKMEIGDFVVHDDKGVGKFDGFRATKLGGSVQDCVRILYAGGDALYVNLNYIHKISKYEAGEGVAPKLSKLGSTEWSRRKARVKKRLKNIARDLIKLYAKRKTQPGYSFPADNVWQKEFEASFIYDDTPDQASSTDDLKRDMESKSPMDRLVCGDVGFGKTEVAARAAFKAVQAGKQVALLAPTTILAQQHYMTFKDRFHRYPVFVEVISRFRARKRAKEIIENTKAGKVDILIGTHRMLSKDVEFKDLGLLIIDEEHRFGVGAKEKLRQMKVSVDTLTLTATPIPRTLNFSLMGARDLSVIQTPPRNRIPVYTEIITWDDDFIVKAIEKEIARGGQIFVVNDRIEDLEKLRMDLQALMPNVRFGLAHGRMKTTELESVMEKFISKKTDVLVTTKIIESGLDIPSANTIIINKANRFGLAELYQLRGRVGRANLQAYCYLVLPNVKKLTKTAQKRLQAIEEHTDLGSGLQLAMRDLEIRGAGDLLGAEQSGFIGDMGFDMYQKVLDEAVGELKKEEFSELFAAKDDRLVYENSDLAVEIDRDAFLPDSYVKSETDRFSLYKQLYNIREIAELNELIEELKDRFGKLPKAALNLILVVKLRIAALDSGVVKIVLKGGKLTIELPGEQAADFYANAFPLVVDFLEDSDAELSQNRNRLFIETQANSDDEAVAFLWRLKRSVVSY